MKENKRRNYVTITGFSDAEVEKLRKEAKKELLTMSAYCRRLILGIK